MKIIKIITIVALLGYGEMFSQRSTATNPPPFEQQITALKNQVDTIQENIFGTIFNFELSTQEKINILEQQYRIQLQNIRKKDLPRLFDLITGYTFFSENRLDIMFKEGLIRYLLKVDAYTRDALKDLNDHLERMNQREREEASISPVN
jgi:hypothetical protein